LGKLILVRHGKSIWNIENVFTGWTNVDLAPEGIIEAEAAGHLIKDHFLNIDICFSSYLKRAIRTNWIVLETSEQMHVDCHYSWKLNERHYGDWQGKNKDQILQDVGEKKYWAIRRGYHDKPPTLTTEDKRHPMYDSNYKNIDPALLPGTESLQDTQKRVVNYFYAAIASHLVKGKTVLITAHGNSLRALKAHLEHIPNAEVPHIEVPTGSPYLYEFDDNLHVVSHHKVK
jgi:2,3-bisphosphoglycerate-dependent phosphoglycerate mutase